MAKQPFAGGHLTIGGTDISDYIESIDTSSFRKLDEFTTSGDAGVSRIHGLYDWSCTLTVAMDSTVETLLWGIHTATTAKAFAYRASQDARGTTNPDYTSASCGFEALPIGGTTGQKWIANITVVGMDGIALIRTATA